MRKTLVAIVVLSLFLAGCGRPQHLGPENKLYPTYGLLNPSDQSQNVCYEVSNGNLFWSILLFETAVMPVYFLGFSLFNPVRYKTGPEDTCGIDG